MIFVPVCLLFLIGESLIAAIRLPRPAKLSELAMFWPEKGQALSLQFVVSSLRLKMVPA